MDKHATQGRLLDIELKLREILPMMFSREDFQIESVQEFVEFLPIVVFLGLVAPFLIAAYTVGFLMDITGWIKSS